MTMFCVFFSHTTLIISMSYVDNPLYIETVSIIFHKEKPHSFYCIPIIIGHSSYEDALVAFELEVHQQDTSSFGRKLMIIFKNLSNQINQIFNVSSNSSLNILLPRESHTSAVTPWPHRKPL